MDDRARRKMGITAVLCVGMVAGMLGVAFSAPAIYDAFCRVTGYGGTTQVATRPPSGESDRVLEIRFDANAAPTSGLVFEPMQTAMDLRLGETGLAFYRVTNPTSAPITAVATYNVTPHKTGIYFQKLQCFCFRDTVINPGETMELPVVFFVDPAIASDLDTKEVGSISLSYTFFRSTKAGAPAVAAAAALGATQAAR